MAVRAARLAALYVSEHGRLGRLIRRLTGNAATAEDIVQDSYLRFMSVPDGGPITDEKAYLTRIARNLALNHLRREAIVPFLGEGEIDLLALADQAPSPEAALADKQALQLTLEAIAALPPRTRRAFEMHRLDELGLAEIGRRMSISTSLAGRLVQEGYAALRNHLRAHGAA